MDKTRFLALSFFFSLLFLFSKIYQHNKIVKLLYKQQRIENKQEKLKKKNNLLLTHLHTIQNKNNVKSKLQKEFGMEKIKFSQIVSFTNSSTSSKFTHV
jgi:hypothetical protein